MRPNWATAPSTGVADLLHGMLAVCLIAALAAHLQFLPNASARPRLAAGSGGLGTTGAAAVYPGSLAQTWQGARRRNSSARLLPEDLQCLISTFRGKSGIAAGMDSDAAIACVLPVLCLAQSRM